ncbi:regulatory protein RecX [Roseateles toxinivorans]|uniref:Regulatory protein RecX n=1 Tax=Roseateles toxinivorans TaxID=270368 RepID=A0A4V3CTP4_9BURK|nr:regulatory protein RecX [Roseateles toxinivorans]TDP73064.1 regulatory protein [Roseateles toxinivorans]
MKPLSLKARAIALLAQREHSRSELQRKLLRIARQQDEKAHQARREAEGDVLEFESDAESGEVSAASEVDALLDWLQANRYLSEARFVESRINARAQRYGNLRIRQELSQHGLAADAASQQALKDSEFERARQVWQRKFGEIAADPAARAKQMRFLAGRGFSPEVIRKVVQGTEAD